MLRRNFPVSFHQLALICCSSELKTPTRFCSSHPFDKNAHHASHSSASTSSSSSASAFGFDQPELDSFLPNENAQEFESFSSNNNTNSNNASNNHQGGEQDLYEQVLNETTTEQKEHFLRHARRRRKLENTTSRLLYEFHYLKRLCQKRPTFRQWLIRDDVINHDPGNVQLSPSMQSAFMRVIHSKEKAALRQAIRDIVPVILYRHTEKQQPLLPRDNPQALIPEAEPATLNAKKREMYERRDSISAFQDERLVDARSQNRLRWKIRLRLMRFQKQLSQQNASATRSILYSEQDAVGYFVFRAAPMYAALHRVFFELCKLMPHFVPKSMLDFGSGTGTAILVAKETYDPDGLALPLDRETRRTMNDSQSGVEWNLKELKTDLKRMSKVNEQRRKARFVAVASLIAKGELKLTDIPTDLRREIVNAARIAAARAKERERVDTLGRLKKFVDTHSDWADDAAIEKRLREIDLTNDDPDYALKHQEDEFMKSDFTGDAEKQDLANGNSEKTSSSSAIPWWEQYVEDEYSAKQDAARRRLRPLQSIVAVEPSPGMVETAMNVLQDDVPNVSYQRYLNPDDATQHDLVIAAYTLSEIATAEERQKAVQELWKRTRGVMILMEYANLPNFDLMMEARDTILAEKDVGLWDWQPTIVGPCPHEKRCPVRHSSLGVKFKNMRICKAEATYRPTFIEQWVHRYPKFDIRRKRDVEPFCYLIFARNEMVPERAERRLEQQRRDAEKAKEDRDAAQRELFKEALKSRDGLFDNLSDEALQRPIKGDDGDRHLQQQEQNSSSSSSVSSSSSSALLASPATTATTAVLDAQKIQASDSIFPASQYSLDQALVDNVPKGVLGIKPGVVQYLEASNGSIHKVAFPAIFPVATHRYNRQPFVGPEHQIQRVISPTELLVIRRDEQHVRKKYQELLHKYWRIVVTLPRCTGKVTAHFCTCEGDLVRATVYRRYYGSGVAKKTDTGGFSRWQYMGGWKYLKNAKLLSQIPGDIPLYNLRTIAQVDFATTLLQHKQSIVEQTAMMHNAPIDDSLAQVQVEQDPLTSEFSNLSVKNAQRTMSGSTLPPRVGAEGKSDVKTTKRTATGTNMEDFRAGNDFVDSIYRDPADVFDEIANEKTDEMYKMMGRGAVAPSQVDSRSPISGMEWANAIRNAKRRMRNSTSSSKRQ